MTITPQDRALSIDLLGTDRDREFRRRTEEEILRCLLLESEEAFHAVETEAAAGISPAPEAADFEYPRHAELFRVLWAMWRGAESMDPANLASHLKGTDVDTGWVIDLLEPQALPDGDDWRVRPPAVNPPAITRWLAALRSRRQERDLTSAISQADPGTVRDVIARIDQREDVSSTLPARSTEGVAGAVESMLVGNVSEDLRLPWHIPEFDSTRNHIIAGDFVVVAAQTGIGKSMWALGWAARTSIETGRPVLFASLEMTEASLWRRVVVAEARVPDPKGEALPAEHEEPVRQAENYLARNSRLRISAGLPRKVEAFDRTMRHLIGKLEPVAVVVDYLGLVHGRGNSRYEQVSDVSTTLRSIALQTKVPVMAVHQFSREQGKLGREPELRDLRDSGQIEQDGSMILLMDRRWDRMSDSQKRMAPEAEHILKFLLKKVRDGSPQRAAMLRQGAISRIDPYQESRSPAG